MANLKKDITQWLADESDDCFIIGEIGVNHNGSVELAKKLIDIAVESGADAVKFQTFDTESLVTRTAKKAKYQIENDSSQDSQYEMLKRLELSEDDFSTCKSYCDKNGIIFLSTPFDEKAADLLERVGVSGFKISSGDLTNLPLLKHIAAKGLPMIISTGMSNLAEIEEAVLAIKDIMPSGIGILHCVSNYPAHPAEANLRVMDTLKYAFDCPIGWSDHTLGDAISIAAVARGAKILEKHYTLDANMQGPDHKASLEPEAFSELIRKIRDVSLSLGTGIKRPQPSEALTAEAARRSIVSAREIKAGAIITDSDLICKRPGTGLKPNMLQYVIGQKALFDIAEDHLISFSDIQPL
ncbi:N-acetylneuraminate synthase [Hellea sp.]|nr:N-acetylneuraminate synthase [Hellea sp.]MDB4843924.1 N-acetylneuraminate synthase [Hellea sp.]MDC1061710.1 N-acetylneuraminate synthase [Hellea sp.]